MKKIATVLLLVGWAVVGLANPLPVQMFSELFFDSTGWKIEIIGDWTGCQIVLTSNTDSVVIDALSSSEDGLIVLTSATLDTTFYINPDGDHLKIGTLESGWVSWYNDFNFGDSGYVAAPHLYARTLFEKNTHDIVE